MGSCNSGGKGATSSNGASKGNMNVPYDRWGEMIYEEILDKDGAVIGRIEDEERYVTEDYVEPTTKKSVLADIDAWRNDDGTYGDNDVAIYLAYKINQKKKYKEACEAYSALVAQKNAKKAALLREMEDICTQSRVVFFSKQ